MPCLRSHLHLHFGSSPKIYISFIFNLDPATPEVLRKIGLYISIILDALGRVVRIHVGSATGINGVSSRWWNYENALRNGRLSKSELKSAHIIEVLKPGHTWHVRPLLLADHRGFDGRIIEMEGLFTGLR
jgi:hypothetical protein